MKHIKLITGIAMIIAASSCTKIKDADYTPTTNPKANNFKEIKVSNNFNWSTTNNIELNVIGFASISPISNTFIVSSTDQKEVYFASNTLMSENFVANFDLPAPVKQIKITYGSISKVLDVNAKNINFDYLLPVVE
ncbi:MAG: hypothetical protein ACOVSR_07905 [Bacteroidia bacterium]